MQQISIHDILLATDFSPSSVAAVPYAVAFAQRFRAKLYLAHVITEGRYDSSPMNERAQTPRDIRTRVAEQMSVLRAMLDINCIAHEVLIEQGEMLPILAAIAKQYSIDLLIMGSQGRRGIEKLLLGSAAEHIVGLAGRPVLMVGPDSAVPPETEVSLHRILHATDLSPESEPAIHYAYELAKEYGASLALVHVTEDAWQEPLSTRMRAADFFREQFAEKHWKVERGEVQTEYYVEFGNRADCILDVAARLQSEMIVIGVRGARHPQLAAHLPGPTAYDVVSRARCPILVIRGGTVAS